MLNKKAVHNLTPQAVLPTAPSIETIVEEQVIAEAKEVLQETEPRIVFDLNEFEVETPQFVQEPVSDLILNN